MKFIIGGQAKCVIPFNTELKGGQLYPVNGVSRNICKCLRIDIGLTSPHSPNEYIRCNKCGELYYDYGQDWQLASNFTPIGGAKTEETDFDFRIPFEDLDVATKSDFVSFVNIVELPSDRDHPDYLRIRRKWGAYYVKHSGFYIVKEDYEE